MGYSVRAASVEDAAGIATVHVASWQSAYRGLLPGDVLDNLATTDRRDSWTAMLANPTPRTAVLVASHGPAILGFASLGPRRGHDVTDDDGELYAIYVHPQRWRQRIGSQLHRTAVITLRSLGFSTATLWVLIGNERALRFYRQAGWRENDVQRVDTGPGGIELPEIQLRRELRCRSLG